MQAATLVFALLPAVVVFAAQFLFPIPRSAGEGVPFRPPGWAFGVAWTVLLLLVGAAWACASEAESGKVAPLPCVAFTLLTVLLASWSCVYRLFSAAASSLWIAACIAASLAAAFSSSRPAVGVLLSPLIAWLIFALHMSCAESLMQQRNRGGHAKGSLRGFSQHSPPLAHSGA